MFSGKSTALWNVAQSCGAYTAFKPIIDNRYDRNNIRTHDGKAIKGKAIYSTEEIYLASTKVVILDEIQFFDGQIVKGDIFSVVKNLMSSGKFVIMSGLDKDFRGNDFLVSSKMAKIAHETHLLQGECFCCGEPSTMTYKKSLTDSIISIGGAAEYQSRCHQCWLERKDSNKSAA